MNKLLKILFIVIIIKQIVWIAFIPLWQFPDEQAHYGQVEFISPKKDAERILNLSKEILLTERILQTEREVSGNNKYTYHPDYNIPYSNISVGLFEKEIVLLPKEYRKQMVAIESTLYPPLYYLPLKTINTLSNSDILTRVFISRLFNIIYYLLIIFFVYRMLYEIFDRKELALIGSIMVAFQPMFSYVQSGINSDALFNLIFTVGIYLSILIIKKGISLKYLIYSTLTTVLGYYTKPQFFLLGGIYIIPFIYAIISEKKWKYLYISLIPFALIAFIILKNIFIYGKIATDFYLVHINLTKISIFSYFIWTVKHSYQEVLPWYWGVFRWLSFSLPPPLYRIINIFTFILGIGVLFWLVKNLKTIRNSLQFKSLVFLIYIALFYFLMLFFWDFLFIGSHGFSFGIQGRYYFPIISAQMAILAFGIIGLTNKIYFQRIISLTLVLGMFALHEIALFRLIISYYKFNLSTFFIQASQYKPWFFKSPILEFLTLIHFLTLLIFVFQFIKITFSDEKAKT